MAGWIKMALGIEVSLSPRDFVLDTGPSPSPCLLRPNGCMDQDATWYAGRPQLRRHCVRWGASSHSPLRAQSPQFSAHFYCGHTAGCIKIPLGMKVGLSPGNFLVDGDPNAPPKRGGAPNFRRMWSNGCIYGSRCHLVRR